MYRVTNPSAMDWVDCKLSLQTAHCPTAQQMKPKKEKLFRTVHLIIDERRCKVSASTSVLQISLAAKTEGHFRVTSFVATKNPQLHN